MNKEWVPETTYFSHPVAQEARAIGGYCLLLPAIAKFMSLSQWTQKICVFCAQRYCSFLLPPCAKSRENKCRLAAEPITPLVQKKAWPGLAQMRIHSLWFILTCWTVEGLWKKCSSLMVNGHQQYQKIHWCFSFQLGFCKCLADLDDISRSLKLSQAISSQSKSINSIRHKALQLTL